MTFSIVAYDPGTGDLGVVVNTARLAVGARVPFVDAEVGAVATQSITNSSLGPWILDQMRRGATPEEAVQVAVASDPGRAERQLLVVDTRGRTAAWTGERCKPWSGHLTRPNVVVGGNILVGADVLTESLRAFESTQGELRDRLLAAYRAGQDAGGDRGGVQSAALLIARINVFPFIDLRVDDHSCPVDELDRIARLAEELAPRLPGLSLSAPASVAASEALEIRVTSDGEPVGGIQVTANGRFLGETDEDGQLVARVGDPGDYYLAAAEAPTPTRAPASYRFKPAVAWVRVTA